MARADARNARTREETSCLSDKCHRHQGCQPAPAVSAGERKSPLICRAAEQRRHRLFPKADRAPDCNIFGECRDREGLRERRFQLAPRAPSFPALNSGTCRACWSRARSQESEYRRSPRVPREPQPAPRTSRIRYNPNFGSLMKPAQAAAARTPSESMSASHSPAKRASRCFTPAPASRTQRRLCLS